MRMGSGGFIELNCEGRTMWRGDGGSLDHFRRRRSTEFLWTAVEATLGVHGQRFSGLTVL